MKMQRTKKKIDAPVRDFIKNLRNKFKEDPSLIISKRDLTAWVRADEAMASGFAVSGDILSGRCMEGKKVDLGKAMLEAYDGMELSEKKMRKIITGLRKVTREYELLFERDFGKSCE